MAGNFLEQEKKRQRELREARMARQNPEAVKKETAEDKPLTFTERVENFWYYHKWAVIITAFLIVTFSVAVKQCADREKFDTEFVLFSYNTFTGAEMDAIEDEYEKYAEDLNGDGEVHVQLIDCSYSDKELSDQQNAKRDKLTAILASNKNALVFIVDDETFDFLENAYPGFFVNIGLSEKEGRAEPLPQKFYDAVNSKQPEGFTLPEGLYLVRRIADETTIIGRSKGIEEKIAAADKVINNIAG